MTRPRVSAGFPDDDDMRETPELELAAHLADQAAEESHVDAPAGADEHTWGEDADADYRAAIDELAFLVDMRREAVDVDAPFELGADGTVGAEVEPEDTWGPFEIVERLGGGVSGDVYKVRDRHLRNHVALKLFHRERVASVDLDSLLVEGRQHALVKHPNIAVIHGADENDGRVGIWMEYLDGSTLQELVQEQGTFGAAEAVNIGRALCSALAAVHQQGLTHGDIKAQNVMREKGGRIVLMDFSSARHVELSDDEPGGLVGTPIYMAPELFAGKPSDFSSDIYALGVLLFYLVTGRHPYEAKSLKELKAVIKARKPLLLDDLRSDLPSTFVDAVEKATAWNPEDRFQSAGQFQAALREALAPSSSDALNAVPVAPTPVKELQPLLRAARVLTVTVVVTAFLALLGYCNEIFFNNALEIPHKFTNYSLVTATVVGLRSLSFILVNGVFAAMAIALLWGVSRFVGRNTLSRAVERLAATLARSDFVRIASVYAFLAVVGVAGTIAYFADFLAAVATTSEGDLSFLQLGCSGDFVAAIRFAQGFSRVLLPLCFGWVVVFVWLAPSTLQPAALFMKWMSAVALVVGLCVMAAPWRLLWQNESRPIELGDTKGFIVAQDSDELYVYSPGAAEGNRHLVIQHADPRIRNTGSTPTYIFGQKNCGEGGES